MESNLLYGTLLISNLKQVGNGFSHLQVIINLHKRSSRESRAKALLQRVQERMETLKKDKSFKNICFCK